MKNIDKVFLICALILAIFINSHYITGLFYDHDVAFRAYKTFKVATGAELFHLLRQDNKPPGINFIFLLAFSLFGRNFIGIQVFSLIFNLLSVILLYLLGKYLFSKITRFYSLLPLFFALFCSNESLQGQASQNATFAAPFVISGILFLGLAVKKKRSVFYAISGLLFGFGLAITQYAAAVFIAALVFSFILKTPLRKIILLSFSFIAPLLLVSVFLLFLGAFDDFFRFVVMGSYRYLINIPRLKGIYQFWTLQYIWSGLKAEIIIFGLFAVVGIAGALGRNRPMEKRLVAVWFIFSLVITASAGLHFAHHFILLLPSFLALSIMGFSDAWHAGVNSLKNNRILKKIFIVVMSFTLAYPFWDILAPFSKNHSLKDAFLLTERYERAEDKSKYVVLLLRESPGAGKRFLVSQYLKEHISSGEKVFIWDDTAGGAICLWLNRPNSCFWYNQPAFLPENFWNPFFITEKPGFDYEANQKRMIGQLKKEAPKYIITVDPVLALPGAYALPDLARQEREAFKDFFDILKRDYTVEKEIMDCRVYRLVNPG